MPAQSHSATVVTMAAQTDSLKVDAKGKVLPTAMEQLRGTAH